LNLSKLGSAFDWSETKLALRSFGIPMPPSLADVDPNLENYDKKIATVESARRSFSKNGYLGEETAAWLVSALSLSGARVYQNLFDLFGLTFERLAGAHSPDCAGVASDFECDCWKVNPFISKGIVPSVAAYGLAYKLNLAKSNDLWRVINSLSIRHFGAEVSKAVAKNISGLNDLLESQLGQLADEPGIGTVIMAELSSYLANDSSKELLAKWIEAGVKPASATRLEEIRETAFTGMKICITGTLPGIGRDESQELVEKIGAKWSSGVSKMTDLLVVGENPGQSKLNGAAAHGTSTIEAGEFLKKVGLTG
jgi:NAD-dependent DNA ligase